MPEIVNHSSLVQCTEKAGEIWAKLSSLASQRKVECPTKGLCDLIFGNSEFLAELADRHTEECLHFLTTDPDVTFEELKNQLRSDRPENETAASFMAFLRGKKAQLSLIVAIADISERWPLAKVTFALSVFADNCLNLALGHIYIVFNLFQL